MRKSQRIKISAPLQARAKYLTQAYSDLIEDPKALASTLSQLIPFHGHAQIAAWKELAKNKDFQELAAQLMQRHYDKRYAKSINRAPHKYQTIVDLNDLGPGSLDAATQHIIKAVKPAQSMV